MKKFWIILLLAFSAATLHAQLYVNGNELTDENTGEYINVCLTGIPFSQQFRATVDYGQRARPFVREEITNASGTPLQFNSNMDMLNYFVENGWQLERVYTTGESNSNVNYIMKRKR